MASIDLESLDIDHLAELLAKAQTEITSREKGNRKELRDELERRVAADGYRMADIFPELGAASSSGTRRKRPAKYRNPQNPDRRHRKVCTQNYGNDEERPSFNVVEIQ